MIAIDFEMGERAALDELAEKYPDEISIIDGRAIDGAMTHWTLVISAAGIAIPAIKSIIVEIIKSKKHKSVTYKGVKIKGYSEDEVKRILAAINEHQS